MRIVKRSLQRHLFLCSIRRGSECRGRTFWPNNSGRASSSPIRHGGDPRHGRHRQQTVVVKVKLSHDGQVAKVCGQALRATPTPLRKGSLTTAYTDRLQSAATVTMC